MKKAITAILSASTLSLLIGACGNSEPPKTADNPSATKETAPAPLNVDGGSASNEMLTPPATRAPVADDPALGIPSTHGAPTDRMPSDSTTTLTDDQILEITHVANQGEVAQAKLALKKAKDPRVRTFASMMVNDHASADTKGLALGKKEIIGMSPSKASTDLEKGAEDATQKLHEQTGADFDRDYVDTQVKEHQEVLDSLDQTLLPSARNLDLKAYLTKVRAKVAMHLQHAKDLQTQLQK